MLKILVTTVRKALNATAGRVVSPRVAPLPISGSNCASGHIEGTLQETGWGDLSPSIRGFVSVTDYGAVPNDPACAVANRAAFQAAMDASLYVYVLPGNFYIDGNLFLHDFQILQGAGLYANSDGSEATGATKLIFTGTSGACFAQSDTTAMLLHAGISDMSILATGTYSWIFDLKTLAGWKMSSVRMEATSTTCGGYRSQKINSGDSSWVVNWWDVQIRLPTASTARTFDVDFSDGAIVAGSSSGGRGCTLRGTGGLKLLSGRYDSSNDTAITINVETESRSQHIINGCQIEENMINGILIDGDANDSIVQRWVGFVIANNVFRNGATGVADIRFKNSTGSILRGGVITGNSHTTGTSLPIVRDAARWTDVTIGPGGVHQGAGAPNMYAGGKYLQPSLVVAQSGAASSVTGTTSETTLATILIPGDMMGPNGRLRITTLFDTSATANNKTLRVKYGGITFTDVTVGANQTVAQFVTEITNRNSNSVQVGAGNGVYGTGTTLVTGAVNTRALLNLMITGQLAASTEKINLQSYLVEVIPAQ